MSMRWLWMSAIVTATATLYGQATSSTRVTVKVDAAKKAGYRVPRTVFGSFLEPIGNSTYNGLWAEILQNPSFEENLWSAGNVARMILEQPELEHASGLGLPLPWEPLDATEGNRYEPRWGDAANSWRSLAIYGVPGSRTGLKQRVYLPVHRELQYRGSVYVKHLSGPAELRVSLRKRNEPERILAEAKVQADAAEWKKYEFSLTIEAGKLAPLEPADFAIEVDGAERALLDQASLMPADAVDGMDPDMVAMAREMKTPLVRFGGNFTSGYHWRDGVGATDKRVSMLNVAWGIPEYNTFGTDEFLRFCERIGAQPQIALNLGSGTADEAADWVRYVDKKWAKHSGLFWELGNELWGNWNLAYPTFEELPGRTREFSEAIRRVDPDAKLIATGQDPDVYQKWNAVQLTNPPGTFDYLSTHFVVTTNRAAAHGMTPDSFAADTFALPVELGRKLRAMQSQIDDAEKTNKAHIAFTEWLFICCDRGPANAPRYDNMGGAVAVGGFFNMLMKNADVVPVSDMTGIIEFAGIWKKRGRAYGTPSYYAFRMYSTADADTPVEVENDAGNYDVHVGISRLPEIKDVPYLDTVAMLNGRGDRLTIFCVNRNLTKDIPATVSLAGFDAKGPGKVEALYAPSIYDGNDETRPDWVRPTVSGVSVDHGEFEYTFRHESVTRIELAAK